MFEEEGVHGPHASQLLIKGQQFWKFKTSLFKHLCNCLL